MIEEDWNQGYVIIVLNRALLSSIRFYKIKYAYLHLDLKKLLFLKFSGGNI